MEIASLLSGGVDSSVVVHLLKEAGYTPTLFYIKIGMDDDELLHCSSEEDIEMASLIARKYGCKLEIIDLHQDYWDNVVAYTIDKVKKGFTPNPDVMCNKLIKFGVFEQKVGYQFDKTATGHYAHTIEKNGKTYLATAIDPIKDQTDFLAQINHLQVSKLMFPLGRLMKNEVRAIAEKAGLPSAKRQDSQGICFLGKVNYNDFIRRYLGEKEGPIVEFETGKVLGKHKGYWFHTVGQRKGLGLSGGPWYVIRKDIEANIVWASKGYDAAAAYGNEFTMNDFHFITDDPWQNEAAEISFKIRHTPEFTRGIIEPTANGYRVRSSEALQGIAPGQFGVIYDKDHRICIGSGAIIND
ncbi:MAG: tRNA 2-thiouridine(34) synthase MnmA [Paludibacter sp.]|jgi:tRNA-specific 2-thiouridylase|nr:tRNA 2-thiouridine(34) synthase MnmA [Paludibacter sp.]